MGCIHLSKDFLLVFNAPEIMCLVFECSSPRKSVSHSSNYHTPKGGWLMISLWTTWSISFCALPEQFPTQWSVLGFGWVLNTQGTFWKAQLFSATSWSWARALENSNARVGCGEQQWGNTQKKGRCLSQLLARQGNKDYCGGTCNKLMFLRAS